jgi:hypothetical protein
MAPVEAPAGRASAAIPRAAERIRVLAAFFGGQAPLAQMLRRLGRAAP